MPLPVPMDSVSDSITNSSDFTSPAPYGRACSNCSRAKCKCMRRPQGGGACERCLRLEKDCIQQPSQARVKIAKRTSSRTVAQLEEKLDDLVTLIKSSSRGSVPASGSTGDAMDMAPVSAAGTNPSPDLPFRPLAAGEQQLPQQQRHSQGHLQSGIHGPSPHGPNTSSFGSSSNHAHAEPLLPSPAASSSYTSHDARSNYDSRTSHTSPEAHRGGGEPEDIPAPEADECLGNFRTQKLKYFPFVHIPANVTAAQLRHSHPFFWTSILAVSTRSMARQLALSTKVRRVLAERLVIHHERSFDTLLALLAFLGWANFHLGPQPFLCMYSHLLAGLVQDLGLDKPPHKNDENHPMAALKGQSLITRFSSNSVRTMEERRAVLAAYLISSEISSFTVTRKIDALRWTSHMEECLHVLEEKQECPTDLKLAYLVKLHIIGEEMRQSYITAEPTEPLSLAQVFQTKALRGRLFDVKQSLPPEMANDYVVQFKLLNTDLDISEVGIWQESRQGVVPDAERLTLLADCLRTARIFFDYFFTIEPAEYRGFGFCIYTQVSHFISSVYRLSMIDDPDWDRDMVRSTIDIIDVMDHVAAQFERVAADAGILNDRPDGGNLWTYTARATETIRASWEPIFRPKTSSDVDPSDAPGGPENFDTAASTGLEGFSGDFVECFNGWMTDMWEMSWNASDFPDASGAR
ncbi:hypothetical protein B0T24DRAFT_642079 [Lasiosphaeria ovina]|uniref:Zn(2)-C6 fungal-type domain-containing protein n=1 Tax=Lasiosphaeria ovina TaxID=92902 RepID=A0AAE0JUZ3_9PEZI|nr:hypothetical protein B0T24DRAFT_642079 [Lasiosphaeria ovina]